MVLMRIQRRDKGLIALAVCAIVLTGCSAPQEVQSSLTAIQLGVPANPQTNQNPAIGDGVSPVSDSFAELEIEDQLGDGESVQVEEVRLSLGDGFLVIVDRARTILGYAVVTPDSQPVVVKLTKKLSSSQELDAILYLDNGDGEFSPETDSQILDEESEIVSEDFQYRLTRD